MTEEEILLQIEILQERLEEMKAAKQSERDTAVIGGVRAGETVKSH